MDGDGHSVSQSTGSVRRGQTHPEGQLGESKEQASDQINKHHSGGVGPGSPMVQGDCEGDSSRGLRTQGELDGDRRDGSRGQGD